MRVLQVCRVAKLFAKHFKLEEQQQELQSRCVNIATGTPNRMAKLAEIAALKLGRLQFLILDTALDAKQRQASVSLRASVPPAFKRSQFLHNVYF